MSAEPSRDDDSPPAWHLLPDDPVGFFGLASGYDRKDLKRAYNALLRRYKPDKAPQEFQKLRAAFEQLDGELRYGHSPQIPTSRIDDYQWKPSVPHASEPTVNRRSPLPPEGTPTDADHPSGGSATQPDAGSTPERAPDRSTRPTSQPASSESSSSESSSSHRKFIARVIAERYARSASW